MESFSPSVQFSRSVVSDSLRPNELQHTRPPCPTPAPGAYPNSCPWGLDELDTTERLHFHFSLSCIGGGNGNPFQCSCLENPRDGGAWWAAVYGVAQSRTQLKRLSSSSSILLYIDIPHLLHPFICWWTLGLLLPYLSFLKQCCKDILYRTGKYSCYVAITVSGV